MIKMIELYNWRIIVKERDNNYESVSDLTYDQAIGENPFWFQQYLLKYLNIP
jgi:hypothetical protein